MIYGVVLDINGTYSVGYISLPTATRPIALFNIVTIPLGSLLVGHEFRPAYQEAVLLLASDSSYPSVGSFYSVSTTTFGPMSFLFSFSGFRYLSSVPMAFSSSDVYFYSMTAPGQFGISGYSLLANNQNFEQSFSFLCETMSINGNVMYCFSGQQLVSIDLTTGLDTLIAEFWCNSPGKYYKSLAFDYTLGKAFSVWSGCAGVPSFYMIDLASGAVTNSANSNLAFFSGIHVQY